MTHAEYREQIEAEKRQVYAHVCHLACPACGDKRDLASGRASPWKNPRPDALCDICCITCGSCGFIAFFDRTAIFG